MNHAKFFVNGSTQEKFEYVAGKNLYVVDVKEGSYHPHALLIQANDEKHLKEILQQLVVFEKNCIEKYNEYAEKYPHQAIEKKQRTSLLEKQLKKDNLNIAKYPNGVVLKLCPYGEI